MAVKTMVNEILAGALFHKFIAQNQGEATLVRGTQ